MEAHSDGILVMCPSGLNTAILAIVLAGLITRSGAGLNLSAVYDPGITRTTKPRNLTWIAAWCEDPSGPAQRRACNCTIVVNVECPGDEWAGE